MNPIFLFCKKCGCINVSADMEKICLGCGSKEVEVID